MLASALKEQYEQTVGAYDNKISIDISDVENNPLKIAVGKKLDKLRGELDKQQHLNEHRWKQVTRLY